MAEGVQFNVGKENSSLTDSVVTAGHVAGGDQQTINVGMPSSRNSSQNNGQKLDNLKAEVELIVRRLTGDKWDGSHGLIVDVGMLTDDMNGVKNQLRIIMAALLVIAGLIVYLIIGTSEMQRNFDIVTQKIQQLENKFQDYTEKNPF